MGYKSKGSKIVDFRHYSLPCPKHPDAKESTHHRVCTECSKEYKRLIRAKFGIPAKHRFQADKARTLKRGRIWELTFEQWLSVVSRPCIYGYWLGEPADVRIGIDRRDNSEGYTVANSQPCCWRHNRFKSDILTHDEMMDAVERYGIRCGDAPRRGQ